MRIALCNGYEAVCLVSAVGVGCGIFLSRLTGTVAPNKREGHCVCAPHYLPFGVQECPAAPSGRCSYYIATFCKPRTAGRADSACSGPAWGSNALLYSNLVGHTTTVLLVTCAAAEHHGGGWSSCVGLVQAVKAEGCGCVALFASTCSIAVCGSTSSAALQYVAVRRGCTA